MKNNMKYTAINIGPIIETLSMARKPRELWAASYMFSYLMECLINEIGKVKGKVVSPALLKDSSVKNVGLYPDRVFVEGELDVDNVIRCALRTFSDGIGIDENYVNIMYVSIDQDPKDEESAIKKLNRLLDCTELCNRTVKDGSRKDVLNLIQRKYNSPFFELAKNSKRFEVKSLAEIATYKLSKVNPVRWRELCNLLHEDDDEQDGEDEFYKGIKHSFKEEYHSYYKYVCVVQADGDNMGKIISLLGSEQVKLLSEALLDYGSAASQMIEGYGGLPIYAGGDDLLLIAPVVSDYTLKGTDGKADRKILNVFELVSAIDNLYNSIVDGKLGVGDMKRPIDNKNNPIHTSLSYGLTISYYKYPLYEALGSAQSLLFNNAKKVNDKNAIAWCLRKHSGSGFIGTITKNTSKNSVYSIFNELMECSVDESLVSAIAHKLRSNEDLLNILRDCNIINERICAFYKKIMEESVHDDDSYIGTTRRLLLALFSYYATYTGEDKLEISAILEKMYGMLRTAKFINGEGDEDE